MSQRVLEMIREVIQEDVGNRGLRADPASNLITACPQDLALACRSLAAAPNAAVAIVTGFYIAHAEPPCGETDGPLGALFLARAFEAMGMRVVLAADPFCVPALAAGLAACRLTTAVPVIALPLSSEVPGSPPGSYWEQFAAAAGSLTHLIALERVGPSHTPASVAMQPGSTNAACRQFFREVPLEHHDRCHSMRGRDITAFMSPAHLLFEAAALRSPRIATIGIGDGGNEIGMGKVPWEVVRRNIPGGGLVACRVPADQLIVSGVSNWGAYGLAAGVSSVRGHSLDPQLFDPERERQLLEIMVMEGPLVDGVTGQRTVSVDGLAFDRYIQALEKFARVLGDARG